MIDATESRWLVAGFYGKYNSLRTETEIDALLEKKHTSGPNISSLCGQRRLAHYHPENIRAWKCHVG